MEIGQLQHLKYLDASKNRITLLPTSVGDLHRAVKLNFGYNEIAVIPANICNLQALEELRCVVMVWVDGC